MNADVKEMWIKALRSSEYKQGIGFLRRGNRFCCLGVLCDLHRKETGRGEWVGGRYLGSEHILPDEVVEWSGLDEGNPAAGSTGLAIVNDTHTSFLEIADLIEESL